MIQNSEDPQIPKGVQGRIFFLLLSPDNRFPFPESMLSGFLCVCVCVVCTYVIHVCVYICGYMEMYMYELCIYVYTYFPPFFIQSMADIHALLHMCFSLKCILGFSVYQEVRGKHPLSLLKLRCIDVLFTSPLLTDI